MVWGLGTRQVAHPVTMDRREKSEGSLNRDCSEYHSAVCDQERTQAEGSYLALTTAAASTTSTTTTHITTQVPHIHVGGGPAC